MMKSLKSSEVWQNCQLCEYRLGKVFGKKANYMCKQEEELDVVEERVPVSTEAQTIQN